MTDDRSGALSTAFKIHDSRTVGLQAKDTAEVVMRELRSPIRDAPRAEVFGTFFAAVLTFGLYPAVIWPLRFRQIIDAERVRLGRLAQWVEARGGHPDAPRLRLAADAIRFRPLLYLIGFAGCAAWALLFFAVGGRLSPGHPLLMGSTWSFHPVLLTEGNWFGHFVHSRGQAPLRVVRTALYAGWVAALSLAFLFHWLQVQLHARSVRRFLDEFNKIVIHEALSPVFLPPIGAGVRPMWVAGAVLMAWMNAPWGIPLMLTGSVQRRYVARVRPQLGNALATRVREMSLLPRPVPVPVAVPPITMRNVSMADARIRCTTEGCRQPLPAGARFCPRCGRRAAPRVDRVA
jgi:hypothetical protein